MKNLTTPVALQTLTQLGARAFMYAALLVVLPSFIAITDSATYADIVLLATLAALAAQFDGGHATELVMTLSSGSTRLSKKSIQRAVMQSLSGTLLWSVALSAVFSLIWLGIAPPGSVSHGPLVVFLSGVVLASTCALANTATRVLFAQGFSPSSSLVLIGGPCTGFAFILAFRWMGLSAISWIAASFVAGYLFILAGTFIHLYRLKYRPDASNDATQAPAVQDAPKNSNRRWVFFSQMISIVLAAKNPYLIRLLGGDAELGIFSIYSACFALMLAPTAAMQIPVLVRFRNLVADGDVKNLSTSFYRQVGWAAIGSLAVGLVLIAILSTEVVATYFSRLEKIHLADLVLVAISATIASTSVIIAVYLTAMGSLRLLAWMGILVLAIDAALVFFLVREFGGVTPMVTIMAANILASMAFFYWFKK